MKKLSLFLTSLLTAMIFPAVAGAVISDAQVYRLDHMNKVASDVQLGTQIRYAENGGNSTYNTAFGNLNYKVARALYDTRDGTNAAVGAHGLGVYLPAKSIIKHSYFIPKNAFVGAGALALHCEDAANILAASDASGYAVGTVYTAKQNDSTVTGSIAAECELTATVSGADYTDGRMILFVEYVVAE